jgi:hypothetical protein
LRASANVSYENAAQDLERYTGMRVSAKTQQRLVHRHQFQEIACVEGVDEISLDGGKVRLRTTTKGESCIWRDYKALCIHPQARMAWFQENEALVDWVNHQPLSPLLTCVGDGHSGILYLENHRHRIINYDYYQSEKICAIASGAVESTVKQIDRRLKISGAQWNLENVSQVLKHRCAYLNNTLLAK